MRNHKGKSYTRIINTTSRNYEFTTPTMVIKEFENPSPLPRTACNTVLKSKESRYDQVIELLRLEHFNEEEMENVQKLIRNNQDRFHIPGDTLEATGVLEHRIITTDNIPVNTKQYRYPPVHRDEIN